MDQVAARGVRIGGIVLLAAAVVVGVCRESAAQGADRSSSPPREAISRSQGPSTAPMASSEQPVRGGSMRYYGGPKSPMWRGPSN